MAESSKPQGPAAASDSPAAPADAPAAAAAPVPEAAPAVGAPSAVHRVHAWEIALVGALCLALYIPKLGDYCLWDPWETHYGEVARRMLEDHDYVRLRWQNESFRSKPVLTFWLMAGSMKLLGVGHDGGWSGEFVASHKPEWALRLPFALFGVAGIVALWYALARLRSKRSAYLAAVILATSPYYFMISRQAITDMPACSMLIGAMALFLLAFLDPDAQKPVKRVGGVAPLLSFHLPFAAIVLVQLVYFYFNVRGTHLVFAPRRALSGPMVMAMFAAAYAGLVAWMLLFTKTRRQVYLWRRARSRPRSSPWASSPISSSPASSAGTPRSARSPAPRHRCARGPGSAACTTAPSGWSATSSASASSPACSSSSSSPCPGTSPCSCATGRAGPPST